MNLTLAQAVNRDKVRATRYVPAEPLHVSSKTIGTSLKFNMMTNNISRTGLLLNWDNQRPIPYIENTIIEMTIDPDCRVLRKPVSCLGKVVRRTLKAGEVELNTNSSLAFGVAIVQIDNTDLDAWEGILEQIAEAGASIDSTVTANAGDKFNKRRRA